MTKTMNNPDAGTIVKLLSAKFKGKITGVRAETHTYGKKKGSTSEYWFIVDRSVFKDVIVELCSINYPFLSVVSGRDAGNDIELTYHFYVNAGGRLNEEGLNIRVMLPRKKPMLPTITDLIPGALLTELEKQEMLGVDIQGIGKQRVFLPESHPKGDYPWRKGKPDAVPVPDEVSKDA